MFVYSAHTDDRSQRVRWNASVLSTGLFLITGSITVSSIKLENFKKLQFLVVLPSTYARKFSSPDLRFALLRQLRKYSCDVFPEILVSF